MEPYVELAIERWAKGVNANYDKELSASRRERLPHTHPGLFRGNPLKATENLVRKRILAINEGNTEDVLKMRAAIKAKANTVMGWEYRTDHRPQSPPAHVAPEFNDWLNKIGKEGWELVGATPDCTLCLVFKRPVQ